MEPREPAGGRHVAFLDNLRTFMIFLVVLNHAGIVYESSGLFAPFWLVDDPSTNDVVGIVNLVLDLFVMPVIFFVSGYLAPASVRKHTGRSYLATRFRRLIVPWLAAVLLLIPLYKVIFLASRGLPQENWTAYFHFSNGIIGQSWLWFLPVLFVFDMVFWTLWRAGVRPPRIPLAAGVVAVTAIGTLYGFAVTVIGRTGWTKTILLDFQNEKLLIHFLVFLLGALCYRLRVFDSPPPARKRLYIAVAATAWIPINVYAIDLLNLLFRPGQYIVSQTVDLLVLWLASQVSLLVLLYLSVATFRYWFDRSGRLGRLVNRNAYGVYVVHLVVLGAIALALLDTGMPSLLKYALLTVSAWVSSNVLVAAWRRLRLWRAARPAVLQPGIS